VNPQAVQAHLFTGGTTREAARILGITRKNLWEKMRLYGLGDSPETKDEK